MLSTGLIITFDPKVINVKESLESADQACLKDVCIGLSLMKCFSEGLGCRKFSGVKEAYVRLKKEGRYSLKQIIHKQKN